MLTVYSLSLDKEFFNSKACVSIKFIVSLKLSAEPDQPKVNINNIKYVEAPPFFLYLKISANYR